jgi:hypothetical protein
MICSHCGALLVEDRFLDWAARWRCLKCGHVHDSNQVQGHMMSEQARLLPRSSEPDYFDEEVHLGSESFIGPMTS